MGHRRRRRKRGINPAVAEAISPKPLPYVDIAPPIDEPVADICGADAPPPVPTSEIVPIPANEVEGVWPLALQLLAPELGRAEMTPNQLLYMCQAGGGQLWFICDQNGEAQGALVTICTDMRRCVVAICCGPNLWDYLEARHQLYAWAKEQEMREVVFYGRDALAKLMPECKRGGVILRKEL